MKNLLLLALVLMTSITMSAQRKQLYSPDSSVVVGVECNEGRVYYDISLCGKTILKPSRLGLVADYGDFSESLTLKRVTDITVRTSDYALSRSKRARVMNRYTSQTFRFSNAKGQEMDVEFCVNDSAVAFRYTLLRPKGNNPKCAVVSKELTAFNFPEQTTTFLSPQRQPMSGWERSTPSYEEVYVADAKMTDKSKYGVGYIFPGLFKIGNDGWALVSETGVDGSYVGGRLSDYQPGVGYTVAYPQAGECNGWGSASAAVAVPSSPPWRYVVLGQRLKPIVETTAQFDLVNPYYEAKTDYKPGRYTWSWLIWQDQSINYADQKSFIDLSAKMGYEYVLVDNWWDTQIGRDSIASLSRYAQSRGVSLMLWYNSNGFGNDAPQTPRNIMTWSVSRKKEMAWLQSIGVKGIKVDFFTGDKQETMRLYEDILSDANDYGLSVIFHGCTMPRGWERMYPNYIGSEACLASENVYFTEEAARREAYDMCMHPFIRNAVGAFDWGGVIMNRHLSRDNRSRHQRFTTDVFEMATAITNQCSVNCVEVTPNVVDSLPDFELDFLRNIPTAWQDTKFIAGYPGKYVAIARESAGKWYVGALNANKQPLRLAINVPMLAGKTVDYYCDKPLKKGQMLPDLYRKTVTVAKNGILKVTIQPNGGLILVQR